jgi:hypothetical protein
MDGFRVTVCALVTENAAKPAKRIGSNMVLSMIAVHEWAYIYDSGALRTLARGGNPYGEGRL